MHVAHIPPQETQHGADPPKFFISEVITLQLRIWSQRHRYM